MNMDKQHEDILNKLLNEFNKQEKEFFQVNGQEYDPEIIKDLKIFGLIEAIECQTFENYIAEIKITIKGQQYFNQKKHEYKIKLKRNIIEFVKFLIPVIISLASFIVSIIAINK